MKKRVFAYYDGYTRDKHCKKSASNDTEVLKNRLLVTDEELRCVLGVGRKTAKAIAQEADAVVRVNGRKLNSMEKIRQYIDTVAGK